MARTKIPENDAGFTIIEVLIAIAIFSIGLMAVGALQARSLMGTGDVARKTEAWTFVDEQAGRLKAMPFYTEIYPLPPVTPTADLVGGGGFAAHSLNVPPLAPRYTVYWDVVDDDPILQQPPGVVFPNTPAGTYTVCKRITVAVTPLGGVPPNDTIAEVQFLKTWAVTYFR